MSTTTHFRRRELPWTLLPFALIAACGAPPASDAGSDGGTDVVMIDANGDMGSVFDAASPDATVDASTIDGASDDTGSGDAEPSDVMVRPDAPPPSPTLLLVGLTSGTNANGASYAGGTWSSSMPLGTGVLNIDLNAAVLPDGRGLGTLIATTATANLLSALWSGGAWAMHHSSGLSTGRVGLPLVDATGALLPTVVADASSALVLARYDSLASTWESTPESTGVVSTHDNQIAGAPSVAVTGLADRLVAFGVLTPTGSSFVGSYGFTRRTGSTWSAQAPIPGAAGPLSGFEILLARRTTADEVVAVWDTGGMFATGLQSAVYRAGAWSAATPVSSDFVGGSFRGFMLASMPDGRIALVYRATPTGGSAPIFRFGMFDGASWSAFTPVPNAITGSSQWMPLALARSADAGAVLDMVWIDNMSHLQHSRLTDVAARTWSAPVAIDPATTYSCVAIASGPF